MKKISIAYFPIGIKYATPLPIGLGVYLWTIGYPVGFAGLALLTLIILTTNYVTEIDLNNTECRDFVSFLWMPFDMEVVKFKQVDKIIIKKENHSQMLNSRSRSRSLDWSSFTGTLILDNEKELDLLTKNDRKELVKGLKAFADFLSVEVEDRTTSTIQSGHDQGVKACASKMFMSA